MAYIYAYSKEHRDRSQVDPNNQDSVVSKLKKFDPESLIADNAPIIYEIERRRQGGESLVNGEWVRAAVARHENSSRVPSQIANLLQNAARYLVYYGEKSSETKEQALEWIDQAIGKYDPAGRYADILTDSEEEKRIEIAKSIPDLHHIAGAFFRRSETFAEYKDWEQALEAAQVSEALWSTVVASTGNPKHAGNYTKTKEWREKLEKEIS